MQNKLTDNSNAENNSKTILGTKRNKMMISIILAIIIIFIYIIVTNYGHKINDSDDSAKDVETELSVGDNNVEEDISTIEGLSEDISQDVVDNPEPYSERIDGIYVKYLKGEISDIEGEKFWAVGDGDTEYALIDMNGDGRDELIIRQYGEWIYDILENIDDKICFADVYNVGSAGKTFINTNNQFVSIYGKYEGYNQYWISELDELGRGQIIMYMENTWGELDGTDYYPNYYMSSNPYEGINLEDCDSVDEEEFGWLQMQYAQENLDIVWRKLTELDDLLENSEMIDNYYLIDSSYVKNSLENQEIDDEEDDYELAKAYEDYIKDNYKDYSMLEVSRFYINEDDVPEVIIKRELTDDYEVLGYKHGVVEPLFEYTGQLFIGYRLNRCFSRVDDSKENCGVYYLFDGNDVSVQIIDYIDGIEPHYEWQPAGYGSTIPISEYESYALTYYYTDNAMEFFGEFYPTVAEAFAIE